MKAKFRYQSWESLGFGSRAITITGCWAIIATFVITNPVSAQIVPDNTLEVNSNVAPGCTACTIEGGTVRGTNLFHSFSEFSVPTGGEAFFNNATSIQNIFTRVTGNSVSNIDGLIQANGAANLFLLNPNGIIFGGNATLNIGGSFFASTASSLLFTDGTIFSARAASQTTPLLTINVPLGLQYGSNPGNVEVQGASLQANPGQTVALVGGDVTLNGGRLLAPGGRVELAGVAAEGSIGLVANGSSFGLSFPALVPRTDVSITNGAELNVRAGGGGSIIINARNLNITGASTRVRAGIAPGLGSAGSKGGDIEINATQTTNIDASGIPNAVLQGGVGNGGDINITTGSLRVTSGAQVNTQTLGEGNAGNVNIVARDTVVFDGVASNGLTTVGSRVDRVGIGNAGNVNITTGSLRVTSGAQVNATTRGEGNAGSVNIVARDTVSFDSSSFSTSLEAGAVGKGGDINITTGSLFVSNSAGTDGNGLFTGTNGQGDGGSININARDRVSFDGGILIFSIVAPEAIGNSGNINITTRSLSLTNGAQMNVGTNGQGNSGKINIRAQELSLNSNAAIVADVGAAGRGQGGNINLDVTGTISLIGAEPNPESKPYTGESTRITLGVLPGGIGSAGDLYINAGSLVMRDGAIVKVSTQGQGNAGNIYINADVVDISGSVPGSGLPSGLFTSTTTNFPAGNITVDTQTFRIADGAALSARSKGDGRGGDITVNATSSFEAIGGGQLVTTAFGQGQAGNIFVNATERVTISGSDPNYANRIANFPDPIDGNVANDIKETGAASGLFANTQTNSTGAGGDIAITTDNLLVRDGTQIAVSSFGLGGAGNLEVIARSIELDNQASLSAETTGGQGNINLRSRDILLLRRGSSITTNATKNSTGGNITIDTNNLVAVPKENSDISANAENSFGGRVIINASGIFGTQFRSEPTPLSDITASSARGSEFNGVVQLNTPDVNPSQGLTTLPTNIIDTSQLIANSCIARSKRPEGKFIITGNGGLPVMPDDPSIAPYQTYQIPTVTSASISTPQENTATDKKHELLTPTPLIEAQGWIYGVNGEVILTASVPTVAPGGSWSQLPTCSGS
ncbi:filamentous hemagglutinin N-terminal domain-containing protein [Desmonostoc muscorum CCALA 125]|nr:filamentous hemagglutinin N-terminal domain-containing protein [Desmonostoc muscorum CCALA 125]